MSGILRSFWSVQLIQLLPEWLFYDFNIVIYLPELKPTNDFLLLFSRSVLSNSYPIWTAAHQASPSFTISQSLLKLVHWVSDAIQPSHSLSSPSTPDLSQHQALFQWISHRIKWPKYWNFSFSISLSNEYSGLISFRIDWLDLLAVQGTLESLLQHHSSKASLLWHSAFFMVQLSHLYMTNGKAITLTMCTLSSK